MLVNVNADPMGHDHAGPPPWWSTRIVVSDAAWVLLRRISTLLVATIAFFVIVIGPGEAAEPLVPTVRLDCEHAAQGCAGMNGDFSSPDGTAITSVAVEVRDVMTGAVYDVTASGCRMRTQAGNPAAVRVHCMIEGANLGIAGDITWSVIVNGSVVWTSPATPTRCEVETIPTPDDQPARPVEEPLPDVSAPPVEPGAEEPVAAPDLGSAPSPEEAPQPILETEPVISGPQVVVDGVTGVDVPAVRPVQTRASSTPPVYTVRVSPEPVRTAVSAGLRETLPETGISLGLLAAIGVLMLGAGMVVERHTRPGPVGR